MRLEKIIFLRYGGVKITFSLHCKFLFSPINIQGYNFLQDRCFSFVYKLRKKWSDFRRRAVTTQ